MEEIDVDIMEADPQLHSPGIAKLIQGMYKYLRYDKPSAITAERLEADLTADKCKCLVAVDGRSDEVIGYLLYYFAYSTYVGQFLFMEDIYIVERHRRKGIGSALWKRLAQLAVDLGVPRIQWEVYPWNQNAIAFYERAGAVDLVAGGGMHTFELRQQEIKALANEFSYW